MFTSQSPWRHLYLQWCEQQLLLLTVVWIYLYRSTANLEQQHTLKKWNKSSNSDLKCIVHEHKEVITGCQVIELSLLSQTRTYKPAWWSAFSLFFFLVLSKQLRRNFNVTRRKTTHDMNGAWWNKHFIVEARAILFPPRTRFPKKVHQTTDLIAVPWHKSHSRSPSAELFFSSHSLPSPKLTLHQQS